MEKTFDIDLSSPGKEKYLITCDCCGYASMVDASHGRYCPYCGRDVVTPITVSKIDKTCE